MIVSQALQQALYMPSWLWVFLHLPLRLGNLQPAAQLPRDTILKCDDYHPNMPCLVNLWMQ